MGIERINDIYEIDDSAAIKTISWNNLRYASHNLAVPFAIELADSKDRLICDRIVRLIPGKRIVVFGTWGNRAIVAKLFFEPRQALRHADRDAKGIKALLKAGVLTPSLFYQGRSKDKHVQVLIFQKVPGINLDTIWQMKKDLQEVYSVLHAVTLELAAHHVMGIVQNDLHFKNFIVNSKHIYTIDGGDVEIFDSPLSKKDSLENLALFFSQLGIGSDQVQRALFQTYAHSRGWVVKDADISFLEVAIDTWTHKRLEQYDKKVMRECSAFAVHKTMKKLVIYDRSYGSEEFLYSLDSLEALLSAPDRDLLKKGNSSTVVKVKIGTRFFVIKRYNIKSTGHWLRRALRETRAASGWRLAQRLRLLGIPTAKPVAFIENRFLGLRGKSYLLMEYVEGEHVGEYFANSVRDTATAVVTATKIVSLFENLARLRMTHGDLKMTNILFAQEGPVLIDLDGMREHGSSLLFKREFHKEIKRFMQNWRDKPTVYVMFEQLVQEMYKRLGMKW